MKSQLQAPNLNLLWTSLMVEELVRQEITYFCIAPGSRSAPLTTAVAKNPRAQKVIHFDERGLGFHALGYARATGKPAVIITTSGTAVANLFPAVIEACEDRIPLLILSADRPPELRDTGANQTIDQVEIFGDYVRWYNEIPCSDERIRPETLLTTVDQAVARALGSQKGPVHLNCLFREPLAPEQDEQGPHVLPDRLREYFESGKPFTSVKKTIQTLLSSDLTELESELREVQNGLLVIGALQCDEDAMAVAKFASRLGWPTFTELTSGLRLSQACGSTQIRNCDAILVANDLWPAIAPGYVLHIGGRITSKRLAQFLERSAPRDYVVIQDHSSRQDPSHRVTRRYQSDIAATCDALSDVMTRNPVSCRFPNRWTQNWRKLDEEAQKVLDLSFLDGDLNEASLARWVSENLPSESRLFVASSMPIRDMDTFALAKNECEPWIVGANRGASGIDGTLATACGFAQGHQKPVTLMIGDLAFLHDLNSLQLLKTQPHPVIAIVINNDGGGIFHFLPISKHTEVFENYFGTPHGMTFQGIQEVFGVPYARASHMSGLQEAYQRAIQSGRSAVIEVQTNREQNLRAHREIQNQIIQKLNER